MLTALFSQCARWLTLAILVMALIASPAVAQESEPAPTDSAPSQTDASEEQQTPQQQRLRVEDVLDLSLEQLTQVPVRSTPAPAASLQQNLDLPIVSAERTIPMGPEVTTDTPTVRNTAAAVYVVTQNDFRRSGARSIPEALRMVPGLHVAKIDANAWAITARGFNGRFANKLLVLIDGRTIYTPQFGGVNWVERDLFLEDVERIEVIRGPGATIWGSNAVNGIINIITKSAAETQGGLAVAAAGSDEQALGAVRYGTKLGEKTYFRLYGKYTDWDNNASLFGNEPHDGWSAYRSGFRLDSAPTDQDNLTFTGSIYRGTFGEDGLTSTLVPPFVFNATNQVPYAGGHILGRWTHSISDESDIAFQFYYDHQKRGDPLLNESRDTLDFSAQYHFHVGERHEFTTGLDYRVSSDHHRNSFTVSLLPNERTVDQISGFIQDNINLIEDRLTLTVGTKLEVNDFTGFEYQPSARIAWMFNENQTVWGAVSRAVRVPSRVNEDSQVNFLVLPEGAQFPGSPLTVLSAVGNPQLDAEELIAYELGYRIGVGERFLVDIAGFYNNYDNLIAISDASQVFFEPIPAPVHLVTQFPFTNGGTGETYGVEVASSLRLADFWSLHAGYSFLEMDLRGDSLQSDTSLATDEGSSPHHQFHLRSFLDLTRTVSLDTALYYVDSLPAANVPSYVRLDVRLGWRPRDNIELVLCAQNLLDPEHPEFIPVEGLTATQVQRGIYGLLRLRF